MSCSFLVDLHQPRFFNKYIQFYYVKKNVNLSISFHRIGNRTERYIQRDILLFLLISCCIFFKLYCDIDIINPMQNKIDCQRVIPTCQHEVLWSDDGGITWYPSLMSKHDDKDGSPHPLPRSTALVWSAIFIPSLYVSREDNCNISLQKSMLIANGNICRILCFWSIMKKRWWMMKRYEKYVFA